MRRLTLATIISTHTVVFEFLVSQSFFVHFEQTAIRAIVGTPCCRALVRHALYTFSALANFWACRQRSIAPAYLSQHTRYLARIELNLEAFWGPIDKVCIDKESIPHVKPNTRQSSYQIDRLSIFSPIEL